MPSDLARRATPPAFEARLALTGSRTREVLVMLLEGDLRGRVATADIRECAGAAAWTAFEALTLDNWRESSQRHGLTGAYARMGFRPVAVVRSYLRWTP